MSPLLSGAITVTLWVYGVAILLMVWRMLRGPSAQDRVLAIDTIYVVGMLIALVIGIRYASSVYFEAALLIALFGFVSTAAMAKFLLRGEVIE